MHRKSPSSISSPMSGKRAANMYPQPARSKRSILLAGESSCRTAQGFRWTASMTCAFSFGNHSAVVKIPIIGRWPKCVFAFRPYSVSKSLAEFAARRRQRNIIIFSRDMCVRENTARAASVEFVRHRRTNYAHSRPQAFCRKNPEGFSTVASAVLLRRFCFAGERG